LIQKKKGFGSFATTKSLSRGVGDYFSQSGTPATNLGIAQGERVATPFVTIEDCTVLKSTASPAIDTWAVPGASIPTEGGATQYFTIDTNGFSIIKYWVDENEKNRTHCCRVAKAE